MTGYIVLAAQGIAGWCDFLNGKPVHCGDQLQLWDGERWVYARYEMGDRKKKEVVLAVRCRTKLDAQAPTPSDVLSLASAILEGDL